MNIYIPTDDECAQYFNPNYIPPSIEEMMEGAKLTHQIGFIGEANGMYGKKQSDKQKKAAAEANSIPKPGLSALYKTRFAEGTHTVPIMKGKENPRARKIHADGKVYETIRECCNAYGFKNHNAIRYRLNHPKWTEWYYL